MLSARAAAAQAVRVEVRDAATGAAVPNALVGLRRADGPAPAASSRSSAGLAAEGITSAAGRRTLGAAPGRYRVEVRRIGHRPFEGPLVTVAGTDTAAVTVRLTRAPVTLAAVEARGRGACPTPTAPEVLALWDAARTALATSVESRPQATAGRAVAYERTLDTAGTLLGEVRTVLRADSAAARVFWATTPAVLETYGFVLGSLEHGAQFHAPDERVLLSDAFARTHCFAPARGGGPDGRWLGVRFTPAPKRRVPEIAGVVWLDSATAEPRRVEFDFLWDVLPRGARAIAGSTEFARLASGSVGVRAWRLRVPRVDSYAGRLRLTGYSEFGGTVADSLRRPVRVAGVVYDSLVGAPLAGALVTRLGAPGVAVTDAAGRFALDSVEADPGAFVFSHPALDSAGLADVAVPLDLSKARDTASVALATPSRATMWARVCGGPVGRGPAGVLTGVVRDAASGAPIAGAGATVAWTEVDTARNRLAARPRRRDMRADSAGTFRLCGLPVGVDLEVRAEGERTASGWAVTEVGRRGVTTVDLLVPPPVDGAAGGAAGGAAAAAAAPAPVATTVATGVVRDSLGRPSAGARVTIDGAPGVAAVTGADGAFRLAGVPAGTQTLVVRAVGYAPQAVTVGLRTRESEPVEVTLRRVVRLAGVSVRGRATGTAQMLAGVAARRRLTTNVVFDSTFIRQSLRMDGVLRRVPNASLKLAGDGVLGLATANGCPIAVAVDNRITEWDEVTELPPGYVLAIEVYRRAAQVPGRFQGLLVQASIKHRSSSGDVEPCGLALVWTRAGR